MAKQAEIDVLKNEIRELERFYELTRGNSSIEQTLNSLSHATVKETVLGYLKLKTNESAAQYDSIKLQFEALVTEIANCEFETIGTGISAAMLALQGADRAYEKMALMFLKRDKNIDRQNSGGCTALLYAARNNCSQVTRYLVEERGADPWIKTNAGISVLDRAKKDIFDLVRKKSIDKFMLEIKGMSEDEIAAHLQKNAKLKITPTDIYQRMLFALRGESDPGMQEAYVNETRVLLELWPGDDKSTEPLLQSLVLHRDYFVPAKYGSHTSKLYINGTIALSTLDKLDANPEKRCDIDQYQNRL